MIERGLNGQQNEKLERLNKRRTKRKRRARTRTREVATMTAKMMINNKK